MDDEYPKMLLILLLMVGGIFLFATVLAPRSFVGGAINISKSQPPIIEPQCIGGVPANTCSVEKPMFCNSGFLLVENCGYCGCPEYAACNPDGSCVYSAVQVSTQAVGKISVDSALETLQKNSPVSWSIRWKQNSIFPKTIAGGKSPVYDGTPSEIALRFMSETAPFIQSSNLAPLREQEVPSGRKVSLVQKVDGLPVIGGLSGVIISEKGEILHLSASLHDLPTINIVPELSAADATTYALRSIGKDSSFLKDIASMLAVFPSDPPRLAYDLYFTISSASEHDPWHIVVDAKDGRVLLKKLLVQKDQGTGRVFIPNPVAKINNPSFSDQSDANSAIPLGVYDNAILENLDPPNGGLYYLKGAFAWMKNYEIPTNVPPASASGDFSFLRFDNGFEEAMAYYTIDRSQAYIQSLGFTDVNNRPQEIDAHGVFNFDNSHYEAAPVGAGYLAFGDGGVDDAEDADIILHEYGHAIQDNSAPGIYLGTADNGYGDETGAMAEGFSDYWAASSTYEYSLASGFPTNYIGEWDAKGYATPAPYLRVVDSTKKYPSGMVDKVHEDGQIWSGALWELFQSLGREKTDKIVLYSHFLVPPNPDFADGARALMDADALLFPKEGTSPTIGKDYNRICEVVRNRGILACQLQYICGDLNEDAYLDALDIANMIDFVFMGEAPDSSFEAADLDGNGEANALDLARIIDHVFFGDPAPTGCGNHPVSMRIAPTDEEKEALQRNLEAKGLDLKLPEIRE
ncbi:MAG TPA: M36 family metallopeptidase [Candidatus Norongarragalinales archaeon]|nr:M36 family metallopeptidase [Candidatus Norongarragalinales archaeon]